MQGKGLSGQDSDRAKPKGLAVPDVRHLSVLLPDEIPKKEASRPAFKPRLRTDFIVE